MSEISPEATTTFEAPVDTPIDTAAAAVDITPVDLNSTVTPSAPTTVVPDLPAAPAPGQISLPSGGTITFRDPEDFTYGERADLLLAQAADPNATDMARGLGLQEKLTCLLITELTLPYEPGAPLPSVDINTLRKIRMSDVPAIDRAVAAAQKVIFPSAEPDADEASPTLPSAA